MTAAPDDVSSFAARVQSLADAGDLDSERAVQLRVVEPLLELLGWDVRGPSVQPEVVLQDRTLDYALQVGDLPAVGVVTTPPDSGELPTAAEELAALLADGHLDAGIATDGRSFRLFGREGTTVRRHELHASELAAEADALGRVHHSTIEQRVDDRVGDRAAAADRLAEHRDEAIAAVADSLAEYTGDAAEEEIRTASAQTVDWLVNELDPGGDAAGSVEDEHEEGRPGQAADPAEGTSHRAASDDPGSSASEAESGGEPSDDAVSSAGRSQRSPHDETSDGPTTAADTGPAPAATASAVTAEDDAEFVARFFGGGSSVGAVGTASPAGTLAGTVRYLLDHHDLDRTIRLPWSVDGERILVDDGQGDGWTQLGDGEHAVYVRQVREPGLATAAIEGLAESAGLRVMFQGDW